MRPSTERTSRALAGELAVLVLVHAGSSQEMEPLHERIAKIALAAGARYGLALAGGYAVRAHGIAVGQAATWTCSPRGSIAMISLS